MRRLVFYAGALPLVLVTLITYVGISAAPNSLWDRKSWGKQKQSGGCEPLQRDSAVREPINSWSNLIYTLVGAWALGAGARAWSNNSKVSKQPERAAIIRGVMPSSFVCSTTRRRAACPAPALSCWQAPPTKRR